MAERIVTNMRSVAEHYGVSIHTVRIEWRQRNGMPGKVGRWDLDEIDKWRSMRQSSKDRSGTLTLDGKTIRGAVAEPPDEPEPMSEKEQQSLEFDLMDQASSAKLRSLKADASKKEADARIKQLQALRIENADIVDLDRVEAFLTELFAEARKQLLRVPQKMRRFGDDAVKACRQEINLRLHGIRRVADRLSDLRDDL